MPRILTDDELNQPKYYDRMQPFNYSENCAYTARAYKALAERVRVYCQEVYDRTGPTRAYPSGWMEKALAITPQQALAEAEKEAPDVKSEG